jgi:hypothetical protein
MRGENLPDAKDIAKIRHNWQGDYPVTFQDEIADWTRLGQELFTSWVLKQMEKSNLSMSVVARSGLGTQLVASSK